VTAYADIKKTDGKLLVLAFEEDVSREIEQKEVVRAKVTLIDSRMLSDEQRSKACSICKEIAVWAGYNEVFEFEYVRHCLMYDFCTITETEPFSLSDCDVSTARDFISYLISFCVERRVPTKKQLVKYADDIGRCMYAHIEHKSCAVCNQDAEIHHVDAVGMGSNRDKICHVGMEAIALCRRHHAECHTAGWIGFSERYHVIPIKLDKYLCKKAGLNTSGARRDASVP
jgi:hypothetical protein